MLYLKQCTRRMHFTKACYRNVEMNSFRHRNHFFFFFFFFCKENSDEAIHPKNVPVLFSIISTTKNLLMNNKCDGYKF